MKEKEIADLLKESGLTVSAAESCTGGLLSHLLTNRSGSSEYFLGGIIAYRDSLKTGLLGVNSRILSKFGAVSSQVALRMADGVRKKTGADIGIAITGIAGPGGGSPKKPVGLVYTGISSEKESLVIKNHFSGDRISVKRQSAEKALLMLKKMVLKNCL